MLQCMLKADILCVYMHSIRCGSKSTIVGMNLPWHKFVDKILIIVCSLW